MSAIGNYVHYTAAGYNKTGTNTQRQKPSISATQALALQKQDIHNRISGYQQVSQEALDELKIKIQDLVQRLEGEDIKDSNSEVNDFIEEQIDKVFENFSNIDFNNDISSKDKQLLEKGVPLLRVNYNSYKSWRQELTNRIKSLNQYLLLLQKYSSNKNGASASEYDIAIEKLNTLLNETYEKTWKNISETGMPVNRKTTKNLINEINKLIQTYAAIPIIDTQNQMLFEKALDLIPAIGEENLDEAIAAQIIKDLNSIESQVTVSIDKENFQDKGWKMQLGDIYEQGTVAKDNITISYKWNNEILNVVAKKLNLGNGYRLINLSNNFSLLALLQEANSDFVNHYLNLFTIHSDRSHVHYQQQRDEFIPVLKLWLAYKSLTGEGINDNLANVYVVNKKDKVEVFSIANFLKDFEKNEGKYISVKINGGANWKNLYSNTWVTNSPSGIARISHVLQEVHSRKINVAFNSSLINK